MKIKMTLFFLLSIFIISCTKAVAVEEEEIDPLFHMQRVGASAHHLLHDEDYNRLHIEVQYMPGFEPDSVALQNLKAFLYEHLHKPAGIQIKTKEIEGVKDAVLTLGEIAAIEGANRTQFTKGKTLSVYLLYTNGYYTQDKMLGYAYRNTSAVLFGRNILDNANNPKKLNRTHLETIVLQHEMGHLLGLVNSGTPLQSAHKDDRNGKHCTNAKCLMYHMADTDESSNLIIRKQLPKLDDACLEDLKAFGGR
jgi:predicted Zn-dependent protease